MHVVPALMYASHLLFRSLHDEACGRGSDGGGRRKVTLISEKVRQKTKKEKEEEEK